MFTYSFYLFVTDSQQKFMSFYHVILEYSKTQMYLFWTMKYANVQRCMEYAGLWILCYTGTGVEGELSQQAIVWDAFRDLVPFA